MTIMYSQSTLGWLDILGFAFTMEINKDFLKHGNISKGRQFYCQDISPFPNFI